MEYLTERIKELVSPLFRDSDLVLVELKVFRDRRKVILRFLVDRSKGGIRLDECTQLNAQIGEILDREQLLEESYVLEISSPGIDRPLVSLEDFSRVIGRNVRLFLKEAIKDKRELIGSIDKIEGEDIIFLLGSEYLNIPIDNIIKAKQIL